MLFLPIQIQIILKHLEVPKLCWENLWKAQEDSDRTILTWAA